MPSNPPLPMLSGPDRNPERGAGVVLDTEGDRLLVQVRYPASQLRLGFWDMLGHDRAHFEVRIGVEMPPSLALALKSTSGDLSSRDLSGPQLLETTSGDVAIDGAGSTVVASSTSGAFSVHQAERLDLRS